MSIFRQTYIRNVILVFTGITFLNMTFFLAEVSLLKPSQAQKIIQSIAKLKCDSGFEEEGGSGKESSETGGFSVKEIDLLAANHLNYNKSVSVLVKQRNILINKLCLQPGYAETFSPPPEM